MEFLGNRKYPIIYWVFYCSLMSLLGALSIQDRMQQKSPPMIMSDRFVEKILKMGSSNLGLYTFMNAYIGMRFDVILTVKYLPLWSEIVWVWISSLIFLIRTDTPLLFFFVQMLSKTFKTISTIVKKSPPVDEQQLIVMVITLCILWHTRKPTRSTHKQTQSL